MPSSADLIKRDAFESLYSAAGAEERYSSADARIRELEAECEALRRDADRRVAEATDTARAEARAESEAEWSAATEALRGIAARLEETMRQERGAAEADLAALATAVASKILRREIARDDEFVVRLVRRCMRRIVERSSVVIRVHPDDQARVAEAFSGDAAAGVHSLRVLEDRRVDRGGCIVETPDFVVDGGIRTQLDAAREAITGEGV